MRSAYESDPSHVELCRRKCALVKARVIGDIQNLVFMHITRTPMMENQIDKQWKLQQKLGFQGPLTDNLLSLYHSSGTSLCTPMSTSSQFASYQDRMRRTWKMETTMFLGSDGMPYWQPVSSRGGIKR